MNDQEFLEGLRTQDPAAVQHLTVCYLPTIWRFVYFKVNGDSHLAEDIVSETMLAIIRCSSEETEIRNLTAWFRTVASNKINDHFRAASRVQHLIDKAKESTDGYDDQDASARQVLVERRMEIRRVMDNLPEQHRLALEWKYLDKISVRDISRRLGLTEKAVESILYRARREFKEKISKSQNEDDQERPLRPSPSQETPNHDRSPADCRPS